MAAPAREVKHLLLTGDDFGASARVNEAVERFHRAGALTQASVMVCAPAAEEAARVARRCPGLCVGLHLTLCLGEASRVSPLTDAARRLPASPARAGWRYALRPTLADALRSEIAAQFARFRALGFPPTYWDGHTHLHLHPSVLRLTLPIARAHGFRATRLVREPGTWGPVPLVFRALSRAALPGLRAHGIAWADRVFGLARTGRVDRAWLVRTLGALPPGWSELYLHPGAEPALPDPEPLAELLRARAGDIHPADSLALAAARAST